MVNLDAYRWKPLKQRLHHPCVWSTLSCQEYPKKRHTKGGAMNGGPLTTWIFEPHKNKNYSPISINTF